MANSNRAVLVGGLTALVVIAVALGILSMRTPQTSEDSRAPQATSERTNVFGLNCGDALLLSAESYTYAPGGSTKERTKRDAAKKTADKKLKKYDGLSDEPDGQVSASYEGRKIAKFRLMRLGDGSFIVSRALICPQDQVSDE